MRKITTPLRNGAKVRGPAVQFRGRRSRGKFGGSVNVEISARHLPKVRQDELAEDESSGEASVRKEPVSAVARTGCQAPEPGSLLGRVNAKRGCVHAIASAVDPTVVIVVQAFGPSPSPLCVATIDTFVPILASEASNLVVKVLASAGSRARLAEDLSQMTRR